MKVFVVSAALVADLPRVRCAECRKQLRAGEVVVSFDQGPEVYVHPHLFVHRAHFDAVLADAPTDEALVCAELAAVAVAYRSTGRTAVDVVLDA